MSQHDTDTRAEGPRGYIFGTASDLGHAQMQYLETLFDRPTTDLLDDVDP